jgi:hypothetical protein
MNREEILARWPRIARYLRVNAATGWIKDDYMPWFFNHEDKSPPCADVAMALDEWADFYAWLLTQRADELAADPVKRSIVEKWTDNMAYSCQRWAARHRGEDPGEWIRQAERRPDLEAKSNAIVEEIIAGLGTRTQKAV